jgi:UDP-N-acetylglucosamine 1-carboxyvinyltransferase
MKNLKAVITGGQIPRGKVKISGAKNAATRILAASLISDGEVLLENFPTELVDAKYKIKFITQCGGNIIVNNKTETIKIDSANFKDVLLESYDFPIRTTYLLVPGLIKKSNRARIPYPGGCKIGNRGYDLHIMVWKCLGAKVNEEDNFIEVITENGFISGQTIDFPKSTIGGTESALICAATIEGETIIKNAYISPEVQSLIDYLISMGVKINVVGNSYIKVFGASQLRGSVFSIMPDRIEAITWIVYGILSGGNITIEDVPFEHMQIPLMHLRDAGIDLYRNKKNIYVSPECLTNGVIQPFELATGTHPGIISDMQPFYVLLGLHANGISRVFDYRYPERIKYCYELLKMYPNMLDCKSGEIKIIGQQDFIPKGAQVESTDLRGSMAVLISALISDDESIVCNIEMALRGYNNLEKKLNNLGVEFKVI